MILFQDSRWQFHFEFSFSFWMRFFPTTKFVVLPHPNATDHKLFAPSMRAYRVNYLVAGSNNSCAHYFHCTKGGYTDPKAVTDLREFLLNKVGVIPRDSRDRNTSKVLIVQRGGTRRIRNIGQLVDAIKKIQGIRPLVQDLQKLSIDEQIKLVHDADMVIMIHGGAIGHVLFMASHSSLFEFYPYSWPYEFHGLVNWVRFSMLDVPIRHHTFDIYDPRQMIYRGKRLGICVCNTTTRSEWYRCGVRLYYLLGQFEVEIQRFHRLYSIAHKQWKNVSPITPPMDKNAFKNWTLNMTEPSYYGYVRQIYNKVPASKLNGASVPDCFVMVYNLAILGKG